MDNEAISKWNLINILNNFIQRKYSGLREELYQVVTFANNINDNFTKNILKMLLGKLFKDEESAKKALEIYEEQITYFAKEKNIWIPVVEYFFSIDWLYDNDKRHFVLLANGQYAFVPNHKIKLNGEKHINPALKKIRKSYIV